MRLEHARAVLGTHDRVGTSRAAACGGAWQLNVLADSRNQLARLTPHAHAVAKVTQSCSADPRPIAGRLRRGRSPAGCADDAPLRPIIHCENSLTRSEPSTPARCAAHPPDVEHDRPGKCVAQLDGQLLAAPELSVVSMQCATTPLGIRHREFGASYSRHD